MKGISALGLVAAAALLPPYAFVTLAGDIARTLGVGTGAVEGLGLLLLVALTLAALPLAGLAGRDRAAACGAAAAVWALALVAVSVATRMWLLVLLAAVAGLALASVPALHPSLVADSCDRRARGRAFASYGAAALAGLGVGAGLVAVLTGPLGLTWRAVFAAAGALALPAAVVVSRVREPGIGRFERARFGADGPAPAPEAAARLGAGEAARAVLAVPTARRLLVAEATLGVLAVPLVPRLSFFLEDRWAIGPAGRGAVIAAAAAVAASALVLLARDVESRLRAGPRRALEAAAAAFAVGAAALALSVALPLVGAAVALMCAAFACLALGQVLLVAVLMSVVRAEQRAHAGALVGIAVAGVGGMGGVAAQAGAQEALGSSLAVAALALAGVATALAAGRAARDADADAGAALAAVGEAVGLERARARGARLPLLSCRGVAVEFQGRRALDDVDIDLEDGELLAVLGTNGSGKTTLLRAISGLVVPRQGSIRFQGGDLGSLDPERRTRLGIRHMPGGRATFAPLTVDESLRLAVRVARLGPRESRAAIERAFATFPALEPRARVPAGVLSSGEQHMLGLALALVERPRLLLVDELSMGVAPRVVPQLVGTLRELNASGVALIAAEQSLEVAVALGGRACFLERGRVRYDGSVQDLATRADLLRPVFLRSALASPDPGASPVQDRHGSGTVGT